MNDQNDRGSNMFLSALIGGLAGALVVYFSDEKRRRKVMDKFDDLMEEGMEKRDEIRDSLDKTINRGRKNIVKKLRQAEDAVERSGR